MDIIFNPFHPLSFMISLNIIQIRHHINLLMINVGMTEPKAVDTTACSIVGDDKVMQDGNLSISVFNIVIFFQNNTIFV